MNLMKAITTVGGFTMLSRIFGFIRDILVASILGAGPVADAFFIAFKFPNVFRRLFAEGAFNAAFVPLFAQKLESERPDQAAVFAKQAFAFLFWVLICLVLVMQVSMPWMMQVFAPGFMDEPEKFNLAVELTRITFPYLLLISLVSLLAGVLNSLGKFAAAAATPVILNLCLIGAILGLTPHLPSPGHALAWGVFGAGVLQFIWLYVICARHGYAIALTFPKWGEDLKVMVQRIIPGALGAGIYQINMLVDMMLASLLPTGAISFLFYADRINQLPLGVIGVAVGTALLPLMSRQLRAGEEEEARQSLNRALEFSMFLTLPAAAAYMMLSDTIVATLFERNAFSASDTTQTAMTLFIYAIGLPAYVMNKALTPCFFARGDTKTPMIVAAICMVINIVFNLILMGPFLHLGLAAATVISAVANTLILMVILLRKKQVRPDQALLFKILKISIITLFMCFYIYIFDVLFKAYFNTEEMGRILFLCACILTSMVLYFGLSHALGIFRIGHLKTGLRS